MPQPDDVIRYGPDQIERLPEPDPYAQGFPAPPQTAWRPTGNEFLQQIQARINQGLASVAQHPLAQGLLQRLRGLGTPPQPPPPPPAPPRGTPRGSRASGRGPAAPGPVHARRQGPGGSPRVPQVSQVPLGSPPGPPPGTRALGYAMAGLAGAVLTGIAVVAYSAVQQSGYERGHDDAARERKRQRNRRKRRRRNRNRRRRLQSGS